MIVKAHYFKKPLRGVIRLSQLNDGEPSSYSISLVHEVNGLLASFRSSTVEEAISQAKKYGFMKNHWNKKIVGGSE